jgi:sigma-E factor negative regulatory protein RseA
MNQEIKQQLSALIDGELERDQTRFLLKRMQADDELSQCWSRWHAAGESLRGQGITPLRLDFAQRIAQTLEAEAAPRRPAMAPLLRWAGGIAVAASVALAALLAVDPGAGPAPVAPPLAAAPAPVPSATPPAEVAPSPYREQDLRPPLLLDAQTVSASETSPYATTVRLDPRIESYLVRHNEATAMQGRGFVPYVTLVTPLRERAPANEPAR